MIRATIHLQTKSILGVQTLAASFSALLASWNYSRQCSKIWTQTHHRLSRTRLADSAFYTFFQMVPDTTEPMSDRMKRKFGFGKPAPIVSYSRLDHTPLTATFSWGEAIITYHTGKQVKYQYFVLTCT